MSLRCAASRQARTKITPFKTGASGQTRHQWLQQALLYSCRKILEFSGPQPWRKRCSNSNTLVFLLNRHFWHGCCVHCRWTRTMHAECVLGSVLQCACSILSLKGPTLCGARMACTKMHVAWLSVVTCPRILPTFGRSPERFSYHHLWLVEELQVDKHITMYRRSVLLFKIDKWFVF